MLLEYLWLSDDDEMGFEGAHHLCLQVSCSRITPKPRAFDYLLCNETYFASRM